MSINTGPRMAFPKLSLFDFVVISSAYVVLTVIDKAIFAYDRIIDIYEKRANSNSDEFKDDFYR